MIQITDFKKVNTTRFKDGQLFKQDNRLFILMNGELKEVFFEKTLSRKQIENIVKKEIEKELKNNE